MGDVTHVFARREEVDTLNVTMAASIMYQACDFKRLNSCCCNKVFVWAETRSDNDLAWKS
jgi:hypothetical protein